MPRVLFVSNGHGEAAIAERIAAEVRAIDASASTQHLPLVGEGIPGAHTTVGPRRAMPSGGLVAMGNVRAFARDVRAGFPSLWLSQVRFLRRARAAYDSAVAVGDAYALGMTFIARRPTVFVGTAKSAYVAPYGPFERRMLRRAIRAFVRDRPTADALQARGIRAEFVGNVIADIHTGGAPAMDGAWIGLLPGSRDAAYRDAVRLCAVVRELAASGALASALLSIAPGVQADRMAEALGGDGWVVEGGNAPAPFVATQSGARIVAWSGELGGMLASCVLVVGQAGTANEAAAGAGIPVVALEDAATVGADWYRMRQRRLLGDAMTVVPADPARAADAISALMADGSALARMRTAGRERIGPSGAARRIAAEVVTVLQASAVGA